MHSKDYIAAACCIDKGPHKGGASPATAHMFVLHPVHTGSEPFLSCAIHWVGAFFEPNTVCDSTPKQLLDALGIQVYLHRPQSSLQQLSAIACLATAHFVSFKVRGQHGGGAVPASPPQCRHKCVPAGTYLAHRAGRFDLDQGSGNCKTKLQIV